MQSLTAIFRQSCRTIRLVQAMRLRAFARQTAEYLRRQQKSSAASAAVIQMYPAAEIRIYLSRVLNTLASIKIGTTPQERI